MKNLFTIFILLLFTLTISNISGQDFETDFKNLSDKKAELEKNKQLLQAELDNLRQKFSDQESAITNCKEEILVLKYGQEYGMRVSMGRVWKGMSENMMRDSWGEPDKIDKNKEKWGVFSQWYYGEIVYFFKDGKLTEWEQGFDEAALEKERQRRIKRK